MKRFLLLLGVSVSFGFGLVGCANQQSAPSTSASTPAGVGSAAETGAGNAGAIGAAHIGGN